MGGYKQKGRSSIWDEVVRKTTRDGLTAYHRFLQQLPEVEETEEPKAPTRSSETAETASDGSTHDPEE